MVPIATLKYLASQKRKDAEVLFSSNRNSGAIYLMGYALEFYLKRKVSQTLGFINGFPESVAEFNNYNAQTTQFNAIGTGIQLNQLRQIKNHDLAQLLSFSGLETVILNSFNYEWQMVASWNPESRYIRQRISHDRANDFMISAKHIFSQIV